MVRVKNVLDENVSVKDDARNCELCVLQYTSRKRTLLLVYLSLPGTEILRYKQNDKAFHRAASVSLDVLQRYSTKGFCAIKPKLTRRRAPISSPLTLELPL